MKRLRRLLLPLAAAAAVLLARPGLRAAPRFTPLDPEFLVPDAAYLKLLSLGHDALLSDLLQARALTYYGAHYRRRAGFPFANLPRLFEAACRLDPRNVDAFLLGANLTVGQDPQASIGLLRLGNMFHPTQWKFPEMIGFRYFYTLRNHFMAARYYEMAARLPGRPPYVPSLAGKLYDEAGRTREAIRVLANFYVTTRDKRLKESFRRDIEALQRKLRDGRP